MNEVMRRLARDQWVRLHGTPRVTVLVGEHARDVYVSWLALGDLEGFFYESADLDRSIRDACSHATERPMDIVAVITTSPKLAVWRTARNDRLAAMVDEGLVEIPNTASREDSGVSFNARSAAEAALYEALEATPATAGRFKLNEYLSIRFGPVACEVDLLSRADGIAIEIDGIHHFDDPDCYRRDRRKDLLLQTQGLIVIRVLAEDALADPRSAINSVCQALAYRRGTP